MTDDGAPRYEGVSQPMHTKADSISATPVGPVQSTPAMTGVSPKIEGVTGSPSGFDITQLWPLFTDPVYRGRSEAIHVRAPGGGPGPTLPPCYVLFGEWVNDFSADPQQWHFPAFPLPNDQWITGTTQRLISGPTISMGFIRDRDASVDNPAHMVGDYWTSDPLYPCDAYALYQDPYAPDYVAGSDITGALQRNTIDLSDGDIDPNHWRFSTFLDYLQTYTVPALAGYDFQHNSEAEILVYLTNGTTHLTFGITMAANYRNQDGPGETKSVTAVVHRGSDGANVTLTGSGLDSFSGTLVIDRSLERGTIRFHIPNFDWIEYPISTDLAGYNIEKITCKLNMTLSGGSRGSWCTVPDVEQYIISSPHFCWSSTAPVDQEVFLDGGESTVIFRRQIGDPTTTLDAHVCLLESAAMALDWHTRGAVRVWGGELVPYCGRSEAQIALIGTSMANAAQAWLHWGQVLDVRSGGYWSGVVSALAEGRAVILGGDYGAMPAPDKCGTYNGGHGIVILPFTIGTRYLVGDPICHDFKYIDESSLRTFTEAQGEVFFGADSPQKIDYSVTKAWPPVAATP